MELTYKSMVDDARRTGKGTEKTMEASVAHVSALLEKLRDCHREMYWQFMREEHALMYDNHYTEDFARWDVSQMFHTEDDEEIRGEHFSMAQAERIAREHKIECVPDVYVAINANYHDKARLFSKWFEDSDDTDGRIVADAIAFYFEDEDAKEGKIWRYINGMMAD